MEPAADLPQNMGDRVQLQQVLMNLMINSIDAMKNADGTRSSPSSRSVLITSNFKCRSAIPAWGYPRKRTSFLMLSLPPNLTAPAWDFGSVVPSLNRMAADCAAGNSPRGASFCFTLPINTMTTNDAPGDIPA
jgi:hypothetical protein